MCSKVLSAILLFIGAANARYVQYHGGSSVGTHYQDDYGNYGFKYQITDHLGASNGRAEYGDGYGNKMGSYNIVDIDGRVRKVNYVADHHGFRADVKTNEPGTQASVTGASTYNAAVVPLSAAPPTPFAPPHPMPTAIAPAATRAHIVAVPPMAYGAYSAAGSSPYATYHPAPPAGFGSPYGPGPVGFGGFGPF